jgi:hypothetical protein
LLDPVTDRDQDGPERDRKYRDGRGDRNRPLNERLVKRAPDGEGSDDLSQ